MGKDFYIATEVQIILKIDFSPWMNVNYVHKPKIFQIIINKCNAGLTEDFINFCCWLLATKKF